jgi:hypothetical protein
MNLSKHHFEQDWSGSIWEDQPVLEECSEMAGRMNPVHPVRPEIYYPPPG